MAQFEKLIFVDLETTGANVALDRITEIGIVEVNANGQMTQWSTLVNPGIAISPFIQNLTGISDAMVETAPAFETLLCELRKRLADGLFIAHNARFDYGFLHHAFARAGHAWRAEQLCTVKLSRTLFPDETRHNLDSLIARHGLIAKARHRALADADLLWQLWRKLASTLPDDVFSRAVGALRHWPNLAVPGFRNDTERTRDADIPNEQCANLIFLMLCFGCHMKSSDPEAFLSEPHIER
jgi:DNA polymerase-3 subunit epsilon